MPIPNILHNIFVGTKLPDIYKQCQTELRRVHPEFEYRLYTERDMDASMKQHFPEYYDAFQSLPRMIMKINMFRYGLMYLYGGVYTDMDYFMLRPFDVLDKEVVLPCSKEDANGNPICLGNCIFASVPNHPFWKSLMDTLCAIDRTSIDWNLDTNIEGSVFGTGSMFVLDMWKKYSASANDIWVPPRSMFHPPSTCDCTKLEELKSCGCYGIHMGVGLWRYLRL